MRERRRYLISKQTKLKRFSKVEEQALMTRRSFTKSGLQYKAMFVARGVFLVVQGIFPHAGGKTKCPAWRKRCWSCNRMNHFAKCCRIKGKVNKEAIKTVCEEDPSDSSDTESLCRVEEVGALEDKLTQTHKMC